MCGEEWGVRMETRTIVQWGAGRVQGIIYADRDNIEENGDLE